MRPSVDLQRLRRLVPVGIMVVITGEAVIDYATGTLAGFGLPMLRFICPIGDITRNLISLGTHFSVQADLLVVAFYPLDFGLFVDWQRVCPVGAVGGLAKPARTSHDRRKPRHLHTKSQSARKKEYCTSVDLLGNRE